MFHRGQKCQNSKLITQLDEDIEYVDDVNKRQGRGLDAESTAMGSSKWGTTHVNVSDVSFITVCFAMKEISCHLLNHLHTVVIIS